jgi:hypothetical protein
VKASQPKKNCFLITDSSVSSLYQVPAKDLKISTKESNHFLISNTSVTKLSNNNIPTNPKKISVGIQTHKYFAEGINSYNMLSDRTFSKVSGLERKRFDILFELINDFDPISHKIHISIKDQLLLTLNKYKDNLRNSDLGKLQFLLIVSIYCI